MQNDIRDISAINWYNAVIEMIKELKTEAKSSGFDAAALAEVVRRKLWDEKRKTKAKEKDNAARLYAKEIGQLHLFDD